MELNEMKTVCRIKKQKVIQFITWNGLSTTLYKSQRG